jgi:hypothetical protein
MPNQMIALQARNPQITDPSRQTAQFANMMNMARQAEAAQLQGERLRQEMEYARAGEGRAAETQKASMRKSDLDYQIDDMKRLRNIGVAVLQTKDPITREAAYQNWLGMVSQSDPQFGDTLRQVAGNFDADIMQTVLMEADKFIDKTIATPTASLEVSTSGAPRSVTVGGLRPGQQGVYDIPETTTAAPRATPTAPQAAAPAPASVGEFGEAKFVNPESIPLTPYQQEHIREMQNGLGMSQPASFTRGAGAVQMTPEVAQQIVDTAVKTGMMAQADFDQLMALAPEQNKQPFMDMLKANNIALQPGGAGQQSQFAVYRGQPMRGAPPMEQTLAQMRTSTPLQQRNPNVSPLPGSSQVPIERVRQEAVAGRETAGEVYAKEKARAKAQREAAIEAGPKPLTPVQEAKLRDNIAKDYKSARSTISMMLDPVSGVVASVNKVRKLSPSQKEAITGYSGYLPSITPGARSADTAIKNLRGKVTEMGKSAAALTGAIGQMAVQEWRIVSDMIASLDIEGMEPADLDNQLDIIEAQARRAAEVTRDAYENQYVEEFARYPGRFQLPSSAGTPVTSRPKAESQIPRIRGDADYNRLKPGTEFIDPNGVRRRKPK